MSEMRYNLVDLHDHFVQTVEPLACKFSGAYRAVYVGGKGVLANASSGIIVAKNTVDVRKIETCW